MKKIIYGSFILMGLTLLLMSNSLGPANDQSKGYTGAPGDQVLSNGNPKTCIFCHSAGAFGVITTIQILDENESAVTKYIPGTIYTARVMINVVSGSNPSKYGFQMVSLFDNTNTDVNAWSNAATNVRISAANNRHYVEQKTPSTTNAFDVKWTAPQSGSGAISFYAVGNGVNGNGMSSGDGSSLPVKLTLTEDIASAVTDINNNGIELDLFVTSDKKIVANIKTKNTMKGQLILCDINGRIIYNQKAALIPGENIFQIENINSSGLLLAKWSGENNINIVKKIIY